LGGSALRAAKGERLKMQRLSTQIMKNLIIKGEKNGPFARVEGPYTQEAPHVR